MRVKGTVPGVYIEELPRGVHTLTGVATSITAFIGRALRGPVNEPTRVQNFAEFDRRFGGLWRDSTMSYAVQQFFQNGGTDALIVRVHNGGNAATLTLPDGFGLVAADIGNWGKRLRVRVDYNTRQHVATDPPNSVFNLSVRDTASGATEHFLDVSTDANNARFVTTVLQQDSTLIRTSGAVPATRPTAHGHPSEGVDPLLDDASSSAFTATGDDGSAITDHQISLASLEPAKQGLWALEKADLFNLLCIPPLTRTSGDINATTRNAAARYCRSRRALYIADPLSSWDAANDVTGASGVDSPSWGLARNENTALYFPYVRLPDPLRRNRLADFAPCGIVAGVMARTDGKRGVWTAPAGNDAALNGVAELAVALTDSENNQLNRLGVNCLRAFPGRGSVVWGARTLNGADQVASEWKYVSVRRTALFIEESLLRGTKWVVFEPNDEALWAQIRLSVDAFMHNLFRQGAFQGASASDAYFVKCDRETTTQADIQSGRINIIVGFAPLKPAEFVIIEIQQTVGQTPT